MTNEKYRGTSLYTPPISMFVRHPQRSDLIVRYCHSKTTTYYAMFVAYLRQLTKNREKYNLREETLTILCIFYLVANVLKENVILKYYKKKLISRKNYRFHKKMNVYCTFCEGFIIVFSYMRTG